MMQPPESMEEEFQDWYDLEHIPERACCEGFLSALRFVCLDGFPRYVAVYDLAHPDVLKGDAYKAISGTKFSPWSKRILPRVHGQKRLDGPQIYPGTARYGDAGAPGRMGLLRLSGLGAEDEDAVIAVLRQTFEAREDVLQLRLWRSNYHGEFCFVGMVEAEAGFRFDAVDLSQMGRYRRNVDLLNLYSPYWRRGILTGVFA
ncbi:hypothetical protein [Sinorhizobium medicae]|uniref:hypothetical protein n=1 Tax=Sinorhizobium medicae TaxID=110321 RepID=UPI000FDBCE59|nr:hypothetical protein [Sinorhizobium medicae]RVO73522.1 hypothetical protein CN084_24830 [Sinorhizobium medicae]